VLADIETASVGMAFKKIANMLTNDRANFVGGLRSQCPIHKTTETSVIFAIERAYRIPTPLIKGIAGFETPSLDVLKTFINEFGALLDFLSVIPTKDCLDSFRSHRRAMVLTKASQNGIRISPVQVVMKWDDRNC